ncbi:cytochrome c-type protein NapC [Niveibacterium umoris]|uniref:Cytochrome c-type protein n=1 Tax=Niveibacterium umoris TaxID=1193620 RepID=A0A840BNJ0_9RHOO|nr:NapC/NirT family cytochrome c [Niveibacterium umoris]MBB4014144.1 cytochrome c-type protein NapC [Niveibacterium umoris]
MLRRILDPVRRWAASRRAPIVLLIGFGVSFAGLSLLASSLVYTSTEPFCATSCHEMATTSDVEYRSSVHDLNRTGVRAICPDCHVPHAPIPLYVAKMGALNDLWSHHVTHRVDTPAKFEAERSRMAQNVWRYMKGNDSRECRHCHDEAKMDPDKQSDMAKARHAKARRERMTCVDCHFAIAHHEPHGGPGPQELQVDQALIPKGAIF